uniref:hypothetical protein n=1 Tax=Staphylococcus shinii TaxID=2912228 RepID=UPI003F57B96E
MKRIYRVLILSILAFAVSFMVITPYINSEVAFAKDEDKKDSNEPVEPVKPKESVIDSEKWAGNKEVDENESDKNIDLEDDSIWTIYAQFIMQTKIDEKEEKKQKEQKKSWLEKTVHKAYKGSMGGIVGNGGTYLDIPYNKMYRLGNTVRKDENEKDSVGTQMASFLSTYSHYGYIKTMSGQKAVASSKDSAAGIGRGLFGGFISIALVIYAAINQLLKWFIDALISTNPIALLGIGDSEIVDKNPISSALHHFFENIGLTSKFWDKLATAGLSIVTIICISLIMWFVMTGSRHRAAKTLKEWIVRTLGIVVAATLVLYFSSAMAKQVKSLYDNQHIDDNIVMKYIFNTRGWAASSNLSPNGLKSNSFPNAKADSGHIDKDFDPIRSRDLISDINNTTYSTLYNMEDSKAGFDLLNTWMGNNNFNVNTYIGDINRGNLPNGDDSLPAFDNYKEEFGGKDPKNWENSNIEYSMWSATQNLDEELKKVDSKYFKPEATVGVRQQDSFSTQSVVLMLQSSFDNKGASFYGYNISPTGLQGKAKNQTTVKTEWKEATLPGDGGIGVAGSYVGLASDALTVIIIGMGVFLALLSLNFFEAFKRIGINLGLVVGMGSPYALMSLVVLSIMFVVSLLVAGMATGVFISLASELAKVIDKVTLGYIPSGFIDMIVSLAKIFFAYIFAIRKPRSGMYPPLKSFVGFPLTSVAFPYDDKVKRMSGKMGNQGKAGFRAMGDTIKESGTDVVGAGKHTRRSISSFAAGSAGGAIGAKYATNKRRSSEKNLRRHGIFSSAKETAQNAHTGNRTASDNAYDNGSKKAFGDLKNQRNGYKNDESKRNELKELGYTEDEINQVMNNEKNLNASDENGNNKEVSNNNLARRGQYDERNASAKNPVPTSKKLEEENKSDDSFIKEAAKSDAKGTGQDLAVDAAAGVAGVDKGTADVAKNGVAIGSMANDERKRNSNNGNKDNNVISNAQNSNKDINEPRQDVKNKVASENRVNDEPGRQNEQRKTTNRKGDSTSTPTQVNTANSGSKQSKTNGATRRTSRQRPSYKENKQRKQQSNSNNSKAAAKNNASNRSNKPQEKNNNDSYNRKLDRSQKKHTANTKSSSDNAKTKQKSKTTSSNKPKSQNQKTKQTTNQSGAQVRKSTKKNTKRHIKNQKRVKPKSDKRTYNESLNKNRKR